MLVPIAIGIGIAATTAITPLRADPPSTQGVKIIPDRQADLEARRFPSLCRTDRPAAGLRASLRSRRALMPPPKHVFNAVLAPVGPGVAHPPPYDSELADGVAALGFHEGVHFRSSEFSGANAVWLAWMNVPMPGTMGSSPDSMFHARSSRTSLPDPRRGGLYHNNNVFDPFLFAPTDIPHWTRAWTAVSALTATVISPSSTPTTSPSPSTRRRQPERELCVPVHHAQPKR